MNKRQTGEFYGQTNQTLHLDGITLTDTEYTHDRVDWHYHENAYFTFILQGYVLEADRKDVYHLPAGSLLYHNSQEAHYNIKPPGYTRGFHIELHRQWFENHDVSSAGLQGSLPVSDVDVKLGVYDIHRETKTGDDITAMALQALVLQVVSDMVNRSRQTKTGKPAWVNTVREILHSEFTHSLSLEYLSVAANVHPVHISREFRKYFHCNLGEYIRKLRIAKAYSLLADHRNTLSEIAYHCGFADQSHFIRCFKTRSGLSPGGYRKMISGAG